MSLTHKWLQQNIHPYPNRDRLYSDVVSLLSRFSTLSPKSDVYTYDDGRTQLLLCVHGLLPITFRQASYNIPISIWIPRQYPSQPPIAYVVPTNDMLVKAGKYVDVSGRCTLEYILRWERKSEGCNLSTLLDEMQDLFSREPPVYSRPKDLASQAAKQAAPNTDRPALPPKPGTILAQSVSQPKASPNGHWPQHSSPPSRLPIQQQPTTGLQSPPLSSVPPPEPPPPIPPPPPHTSPSPPQRGHSFIDSPPPPNFLDEESAHMPYSSPPQASTYALPPPRPPNPELLHLHEQVYAKLSSELASLSQALALDAERLRAHQTDLLAGEPAIRDEMARLEAVRGVCRNVADRMRGTVDQAERNVAELRRKGDPEVDELICSTTIVHNQLINLVAEDNAIEDTIYHLHRALNTGRIDLERFLRTARVLAEEQFMKRALIEKIQTSVPLHSMMGTS